MKKDLGQIFTRFTANDNKSPNKAATPGLIMALGLAASTLSGCASMVPSIETYRAVDGQCQKYFSKNFNPGILFFLPRLGFTNNTRVDQGCLDQRLVEGLMGRGDEELQAISIAIYKQLPAEYQASVNQNLIGRGTTIEAQMAILPDIVDATFEDDVAIIYFRKKGQSADTPPEMLIKHKQAPAPSTITELNASRAPAAPKP